MPDVTTGDLRTHGGLKPLAVALPEDGLVFVDPYASWVLEGRKPIILKPRRLKISGRPMFFVKGDRALGIIQLSEPQEIDLDQFRRMADQHLIDEPTRRRSWPGRRKWFAYRVVKLRAFARPLNVERPAGTRGVIRGVKFDGDVVAMFEITKAEGESLDRLREALRSLVPAAKTWADATLEFLKGPKETVDAVRSAPDVARRMLEAVGGGRPVPGTDFPVALRAAIKEGKAAVRALRRADGAEIVRTLEKWLEALEELDRIIPALDNVENDPMVAKLEFDGRDGGAHKHGLRLEVPMTEKDGSHGHAFVVALEAQIADGVTLAAGHVLVSEKDGAHVHAFLSGPGSTDVPSGEIDPALLPSIDAEFLVDFLTIAREQGKDAEVAAFEAELERRGPMVGSRTRDAGEHAHVVKLPDGRVIMTERDGKHAHALLGETTGYDGPHVHELRLPDGAIIRSTTPDLFRRVRAASPEGADDA